MKKKKGQTKKETKTKRGNKSQRWVSTREGVRLNVIQPWGCKQKWEKYLLPISIHGNCLNIHTEDDNAKDKTTKND